MSRKPNSNENEKSDSREPNEAKKAESHSVYTYLSDHPSILIASISAIVAISSFFINFFSYMKEAQTLRFWNIDPALVCLNNQQTVYFFCFSLLYCIIAIIAISLISNTYLAYKPFVEYMISVKAKLSHCQKRLKKIKKKYISIKRVSRNLQESTKGQPLSQEEEDIGREIEEEIAVCKSLKREAKRKKRSFVGMLCVNLSIAFILTGVASVIFICFLGTKHGLVRPIVTIIISTIIQFLLFCLSGYLGMRFAISKKKIIAQSENGTIDFSENIYQAEYPVMKIAKQGLSSFFSNATFFFILLNMVCLFIIYLLAYAIPQSTTIQERKQFKILSIENIQYVVIYSDPEKMVLEEATITDGVAAINVSKQRIVSVDAYPFEVITLEKAIRVNNNTQ